jgi:hypothetical protein
MRFFIPDPVPNRGALNPPDPVPVPDSGFYRIPVYSGTGFPCWNNWIPIDICDYRQLCLVS